MNMILTLLGAAMLVLLGLATVLGAIILILYEARWILRLGKQLLHSAAAAERVGAGPGALHDEGGGY